MTQSKFCRLDTPQPIKRIHRGIFLSTVKYKQHR